MKNWNLFLFAARTDKQLLVSPKTNTASGIILSRTSSILISILPIVPVGDSVADSRKKSGFGISRSSKKISFKL